MSLIRKPDAGRGGAQPLITKPTADVFRDSTAVKVVRGSRMVAVEGGGAAMRTVGKLWLAMLLVAFILSGLAALPGVASSWRGLLVLPLIGGAGWLLVKLFSGPKRASDEAILDGAGDPLRGISGPLPEHLRATPTEAVDAFHVDYWQRALTEKAALLGVVGFLLFMGGITSIFAVYLLGRAVLLLSPLLGDRVCVAADEHGLTVHSLIGRKTMGWHKIDGVVLQTFRFWSLWTSVTTGGRRHLVVSARDDFERVELLIPYTLCGLDHDGAKRLAQRIMDARDGFAPRGASLPRVVARSPAPASAPAQPQPQPSYRDTPDATFDPDAIMARYLAERSQVIESSDMPRPPGVAVPRGFGRKGLVASD